MLQEGPTFEFNGGAQFLAYCGVLAFNQGVQSRQKSARHRNGLFRYKLDMIPSNANPKFLTRVDIEKTAQPGWDDDLKF